MAGGTPAIYGKLAMETQNKIIGCFIPSIIGLLYCLFTGFYLAQNGFPLGAMIMGIFMGFIGLIMGGFISLAIGCTRESSPGGRFQYHLITLVLCSLIIGFLLLLNFRKHNSLDDPMMSLYGFPVTAVLVNYLDLKNIRQPWSIYWVGIEINIAVATVILAIAFLIIEAECRRIYGNKILLPQITKKSYIKNPGVP
jgi:hypothetical protein